MEELERVHRRSLEHNRELARNAGGVVAALRREGMPSVVLKGCSLCPLHYRDWGARRMADADLLVPAQRAREAIGVLQRLGLDPRVTRPESLVVASHAQPFFHDGGWSVDLHWYSLWRVSSDERLWQQAVPFELGGAPALAPAPTHQLLHVCAHGADWNEIAPLRWVADAFAVLRSSEIDWELFERETSERALAPVLADALGYLVEAFQAPVPNATLERLRGMPSPRFAVAGHRAATQPYSPRRTLRVAWERYRRLRVLKPPGPRPRDPLSFLYGYFRQNWGFDRPWELVPQALRRLRR
jgi:Uncharacterised nucleotidyltransferase